MQLQRQLQLLAGALVFFATAAADDGVVEINQASALAGSGFPIQLDAPGSYRLTGDLEAVPEGQTAIVVNAENVTLDLNGFTIRGAGGIFRKGGGGGGAAIDILGNNARIRNGAVLGAVFGVYVVGFGTYLEDLQVVSSGFGIAGIMLDPPLFGPEGPGTRYEGEAVVLDQVTVRGGYGNGLIVQRNVLLRDSRLAEASDALILVPEKSLVDVGALMIRIESSVLELGGLVRAKGIEEPVAIRGCANLEFEDSQFDGSNLFGVASGIFLECLGDPGDKGIPTPIARADLHVRDSIFSDGQFGTAFNIDTLVIEGSTFDDFDGTFGGIFEPANIALSGNRFNGNSTNPFLTVIKGLGRPAAPIEFGTPNLCQGDYCLRQMEPFRSSVQR